MTINYLKVGIAALALICITVLIAINAIDHGAGVGLIGSIVGYAIGNGIAARQDVEVTPLFRKTPAIPEIIATTSQEGNSTNG